MLGMCVCGHTRDYNRNHHTWNYTRNHHTGIFTIHYWICDIIICHYYCFFFWKFSGIIILEISFLFSMLGMRVFGQTITCLCAYIVIGISLAYFAECRNIFTRVRSMWLACSTQLYPQQIAVMFRSCPCFQNAADLRAQSVRGGQCAPHCTVHSTPLWCFCHTDSHIWRIRISMFGVAGVLYTALFMAYRYFGGTYASGGQFVKELRKDQVIP